jgi:HK97 family phage prohead protease
MKFTGHASLVETPYSMGWYDETIGRGAFKASLNGKPDVQLLINHEGLPLARTGQNMTLAEDSRGLAVDADLDDEDPDVQLLARKMRAGLIDQMSFAFRAVRQSWNEDFTARRITECDLHRGDVSVVNQGASPTTSAAVRNLRSSIIGLGGRSTLPERKELASAIGNAVIGEVRSFTLDGRRYDLAPMAEHGRYARSQQDAGNRHSHYDGPPATAEEEALRARLAELEEAEQRGWRERLPVFDSSAERARLEAARLEALRYPRRPAA